MYSKWLFTKKDFNTNLTLQTLYDTLKNLDYTNIIREFTDRLKLIDYKFTDTEQVSGSICFYGGVITSLIHFGYVKNKEHLFTFALCYMLIDHYLDSAIISDSDKSKTMKEVFDFIENNQDKQNNSDKQNNGDNADKEDKQNNSDNILINACKERYLDMIKSTPQIQKYIIKLFKSEYKSHKLNSHIIDFDRNIYKSTTEKKGGLTAIVISIILELDSEINIKNAKELGECIQLVDDLIDLKDDESLNIITLARFDLIHNENLDSYIIYTLNKIYNLSDIYNLYKPILSIGVILSIHDNKIISDSLYSHLEIYDIFSSTTSKNTINSFLYDKLYPYFL